MSQFVNPDQVFFDNNTGRPVANGTVYFGQPNQDPETNDKQPYSDKELTTAISATQTLTAAGKFAQAVYLSGAYSITVRDSGGALVFTSLLVTGVSGSFGVIYLEDEGVTGDGVTNDTAAIVDVLANAANKIILGNPSSTYLVDPISLVGSANQPYGIDFRNATLKARTEAQSHVLYVENPQISTSDPVRFFLRNLKIDGDDKAVLGFHVKGSQYCNYTGIQVRKCTSRGVYREAAAGYGIYYNNFDVVVEENGSRAANDGGFVSITTDGTFRIASNQCRVVSNGNFGHGLVSDYDQDCYEPSFENNDFTGWKIDNTRSITVKGGYSEANSQNVATDGVSDGSDDESFELLNGSTGARGIKIIGGRHIGNVIGAGQYNAGNEYNSSTNNTYSVPPHVFKNAVTVEGDLAADFIKGFTLINEIGQSINDSSTYDVTSDRSELASNAVYQAVLAVSGSTRGQIAWFQAVGAAGSVVLMDITPDHTTSDVVWATDGSKIQITNSSGSARTVFYSILRLM